MGYTDYRSFEDERDGLYANLGGRAFKLEDREALKNTWLPRSTDYALLQSYPTTKLCNRTCPDEVYWSRLPTAHLIKSPYLSSILTTIDARIICDIIEA